MNREIKFRAFDTKNQKWLTTVPCLEYLLDDEDSPVSHHDVDMEGALYFYPMHPMGPTFNDRVVYQQYTGLKDKNGKEIYEGDIVKFSPWNSPKASLEKYLCESLKQISWGPNHGQFPNVGWVAISLSPADLEDGHSLNIMDSRNIDILGNIFENPELL